MKTIFITGAAGLIGSRLAEWILANQPGYRVVAIDDLSGGYRSNVPDGAAFVKLDLAAEDVDELFARYRPAIVYHCAAYAAEGLSPFMRRYNEWHLVFKKSFQHIAFRIRSRFHEPGVMLGSAFYSTRFIAVGAIGDSVFGDGVE